MKTRSRAPATVTSRGSGIASVPRVGRRARRPRHVGPGDVGEASRRGTRRRARSRRRRRGPAAACPAPSSPGSKASGEQLEHQVAVAAGRRRCARAFSTPSTASTARTRSNGRPCRSAAGASSQRKRLSEQREAPVPPRPGDLRGLRHRVLQQRRHHREVLGRLGAQPERPLGAVLEAGVLGHAARLVMRSMRGAAGRELLLDPLVAAVEVVDPRHPRLALGGEAGEDQADARRAGRSPSPARPCSFSTPVTVAVPPCTSMLRAHAHQLGRVHEAVLEDALLEVADPVGEGRAAPSSAPAGRSGSRGRARSSRRPRGSRPLTRG